VSPGASIGTLTFADNLVLSGTTGREIDRDTIRNADLVTANSLTYGGTLVVTNIGGPIQAGDTFNLFDWTSRNGSFAAVVLPPLAPGLSWDDSQLEANGTLSVISGVSTTPIDLTFQITGNLFDIGWP